MKLPSPTATVRWLRTALWRTLTALSPRYVCLSPESMEPILNFCVQRNHRLSRPRRRPSPTGRLATPLALRPSEGLEFRMCLRRFVRPTAVLMVCSADLAVIQLALLRRWPRQLLRTSLASTNTLLRFVGTARQISLTVLITGFPAKPAVSNVQNSWTTTTTTTSKGANGHDAHVDESVSFRKHIHSTRSH